MEWTEKQIEFLRKNYSQRGKKWCVAKMNLKECQIRYMASKLGLKVDLTSNLLDYDNNAKGVFRGKKRPEHSKIIKQKIADGLMKPFLRREKETIITKCVICGNEIISILPINSKMKERIRKTCSDECRNNIFSEKLKERIKQNGHTKGMKGKTHSDKIKKDLSDRFIKMWEDPYSYFNSHKYRQFLSDRNMTLHKQGILGGNTSYSNCKRGWFIDGNKKYFMRSGWEIRYATYLNMLKKGKAIKDWEYEVDTFWFHKIKRGVRSYKPDFKIYNTNGTIEYHEVKGRMDAKSKTKLKRMKKYYPEIIIIIKDEIFFKQNKSIIPSYEYAISKYS